MEQVFNFTRWWLLVQRHWSENRKRYILAIPAIAALIAAWYGFIYFISSVPNPLPESIQYITYYTGLFIVGCLYGSTIFSELGTTSTGIAYLLLPASALEKLLCALFFSVVLLFVFYSIAFYVVDIPMVKFINTHRVHYIRPTQQGYTFEPSNIVNILKNLGNLWDAPISAFLLIYLSIQSVFILGSVYFRRLSFIKTIVTVLLLIVFFVVLVNIASGIIVPNGWDTIQFQKWGQYNGIVQSKAVVLPGWMEKFLLLLIQYPPPFIFWFITYIRLKEKEV